MRVVSDMVIFFLDVARIVIRRKFTPPTHGFVGRDKDVAMTVPPNAIMAVSFLGSYYSLIFTNMVVARIKIGARMLDVSNYMRDQGYLYTCKSRRKSAGPHLRI